MLEGPVSQRVRSSAQSKRLKLKILKDGTDEANGAVGALGSPINRYTSQERGGLGKYRLPRFKTSTANCLVGWQTIQTRGQELSKESAISQGPVELVGNPCRTTVFWKVDAVFVL